jgi:uncharacterized protein YkwD
MNPSWLNNTSFLVVFLLSPFLSLYSQPSPDHIDRVLQMINAVRGRGLKCGKDYMPPAKSLAWSKQLYSVAKGHAVYMSKTNHFSHTTLTGEDVGDRFDQHGFTWEKAGENLAHGTGFFPEILEAWMKSPDHCRVLMDAEMTEMGLAKKGKYWVQTFKSGSSFSNR